MRVIERCGLCGGEDLESVLSLGSSPPTCAMRPVGSREPERHYPLELLRCADCTLVQLSVVVDPGEVFPVDYPYSSGNSPALHKGFEDLAREANVGPDDLVVDIGANDGTLLSKFDCRTVGVEPTRQAEKIIGPAYQGFFDEAMARNIVHHHGQASVVTACNVLAHVEDLHGVMRGIKWLLAPDGVLIAENHDLASVVDGGQWDAIYHEHLRFFSPFSFHRLLATHGFELQGWRSIPSHGGSFRMMAGRGGDRGTPVSREYGFMRLAHRAKVARTEIRQQFTGGGIWGIGATARATTLINYCGLDVEDVECVCEVAGSDKIGRYIPGTRIPVVDEARLIEEQPDRALLLSWHLADSIVPKLRARGYAGTILVPPL